jgi:polar amino acid transport system substrate-binding protein
MRWRMMRAPAATVTAVADVPDTITSDLAPAGVLRAANNLVNPVLAQGTAAAPSGVTVDIARELGRRLGLPVELVCFDAARLSFEAMVQGRADICFLAIEPARAAEVAFTAPYVVIEGVYVVPADSAITTPADVDSEHIRVGVNQGSAYDLFLTRTLRRATLIRTDDGLDAFRDQGLEAGAGIRQAVTGFAARHPGLRVIEERFMQIRQALGTTRTRTPETAGFLAATIEDLKASGFVRDALLRSGQDPAAVAPPGSPA